MSDSKKVLIVDDDPTTVSLIRHILEKNNYEIDEARDGEEGLRKIEEFKPLLVLCDIVLPKVDGFSFCRQLRRTHPDTPIVSISARPEMEKAFLSLGVKVFLAKPIDTQQLLLVVSDLIGVSSLQTADLPQETVAEVIQSLPPESRIGSGKKILVVDDEAPVREMTKSWLERSGYQVILAESGQDGLAFLDRNSADMVIADVVMSEMDGFVFYKELRKNEATSRIPVLIVTGRRQMEDSLRALGVAHFMIKPFEPQQLLDKVGELTQMISPAEIKIPVEDLPKQSVPELQVISKPDKIPEEKSGREKISTATGKKVLIFGFDKKILDDMSSRLEKENCRVIVAGTQEDILSTAEALTPEIFILQLYVNDNPLDAVIEHLNKWIHKKIRENEAELKKKKNSSPVFKEPAIILYSVLEDINVGGSSAAEHAASMEDLLQRCSNHGITKHVGMYLPLSFISRIKEFLKA